MAYNTKPIVTDKDGNPISQYYNKALDKYEPVEGLVGANKIILYNADGTENNSLSLIPILDKLSQLTGTVIDENTRKSNELQRIAFYNQLQQMLADGELKGEQGIQGIQGLTGKGLEFNWRGTELGFRVEGDTNYVYVDLKGETGSIENLTSQHVTNALGYTPANKADYIRQTGYGITTGNANSYVLTLEPPLESLVDGVCVAVKVHAENTGSSNLNVNGLGAKVIRNSYGDLLRPGDLRKNTIHTMRYDGTSFQLQGEGGEESFTPGEKIIYNDTQIYTNKTEEWPPVIEVTCMFSGLYRISFDLSIDVSRYEASAQIEKNSLDRIRRYPVGIRRVSKITEYTTFTEDIFFSSGDKIQVILRSSNINRFAKLTNFTISVAEDLFI